MHGHRVHPGEGVHELTGRLEAGEAADVDGNVADDGLGVDGALEDPTAHAVTTNASRVASKGPVRTVQRLVMASAGVEDGSRTGRP